MAQVDGVRTRGKAAAAAAAVAGGAAAVAQPPAAADETLAKRAPCTPPPFTLGDLKAAIPAHCFEKSLLYSFGYLALDLVVAASLWYISATYFWQLPLAAGLIAWPLYWICQGCICTGIWVIAHECGHRAFANSKFVCDAVGLVLHSALLVPYHSWRISHGKHHRSTGDADRDEAFAPYVAAENDPVRQLGAPGPLRVCIEIAITLLFGWPAYLTTHVTGHKYERRNNHFEPWSPMFSKDEYWLVVLSDAALLVVLAGLGSLAYTYSFAWLFAQYVVPLLIVNFWLVLITYLQHTDETLPHFRGTEWSWLRGALCTVDRDFGLLNHVFHHIGDTHVTHHVFSYMPHYHAEEATAALKPLLGEYYRRDDTPIAVALWRSFNVCRFVDATGEVLWFRQ